MATLLILYCAVVMLASLAGGWLPLKMHLTHKRLELAVSFVAGAMLGVALLHLLPHALMERAAAIAAHEAGHAHDARHAHEHNHALIDPVMWWLLGGFLAMFFIERFFCFHHHDAPDAVSAGEPHSHDDACAHDHARGAAHTHHHNHRLTWTAAAVGLSLHSVLDGIALAASVAAGLQESPAVQLAGVGTLLVITLHKPFDSMTLGTLMAVAGRSVGSRWWANVLYSLTVPLGAVLLTLGALGGNQPDHLIVSAALAFSAGTFLCISLSDLLPELQFHQHDRLKLSAALLLGLALAWATGLLDPHR